jgi:3-hydroxyisobutyrate dehydrogenase
MMALINLAGFCESMAIGKKFGLDPKQLYGMISESGGRSWMSELKGPKLLNAEYSPDFALELAAKDVALGKALSDDIEQYAPMIAAAAKVFKEATPSGTGEDMASLYRWYVEKTGGREV